jgi:uncharacterized protein YcnI
MKRLCVALTITGALAFAAQASAHARVSPAVSLSGKLQLYSLAVPTEKNGLFTTRIVLTLPNGFSIDSFAPPPAGWHQTASGSQVTWTGGHVPTGEDSLFQFLAQGASAKTYTFQVEQTYSDGSIVNWSGPESSDHPAPTIEAAKSLGGSGGGTSALSVIALIVGVLGLLAGGLALSSRKVGGRSLA